MPAGAAPISGGKGSAGSAAVRLGGTGPRLWVDPDGDLGWVPAGVVAASCGRGCRSRPVPSSCRVAPGFPLPGFGCWGGGAGADPPGMSQQNRPRPRQQQTRPSETPGRPTPPLHRARSRLRDTAIAPTPAGNPPALRRGASRPRSSGRNLGHMRPIDEPQLRTWFDRYTHW